MEENQVQLVFSKIDNIKKKIDLEAKQPAFSDEIKNRLERNPGILKDETQVLRCFARLIAFSQAAKSNLVESMLARGTFNVVFANFNVNDVAHMEPDQIKALHWDDIKVIRYPSKLKAIIECAKSLQSIERKHGTFMNLLMKCKIQLDIKSETDINEFWVGFDKLKQELEDVGMPFFKSSTSLLHLLLHVGYPCIKPDSTVMKKAKELEIVESCNGEQNRRSTVTFLQRYCVSREIKPSIIDLYLLIDGGQTWAKEKFCQQV